MDQDRAVAIFNRFTKEVGQPAMNRILDDVADVRKAFGGVVREIEGDGTNEAIVHDRDLTSQVTKTNAGIHLLLLCMIEEAKRVGVAPDEVHNLFHAIVEANMESHEEHETRKANVS